MKIALLTTKMSSKQEKVRELILSTYLQNPGLKYSAIAKIVGASERTVKTVISNYKKGLPVSRKKGSGRKPEFSNPKVAAKVKRLFKQNPNTSVRDMADRAGTSKSTVQRIKEKSKLKTYRVQKVPDRSDEKQLVAQMRARKLYERYLTKFDCCVMDDETYVKADFKQLPGHEYYTSPKKGNVPSKFKEKKISKFPKQYMVWQAICTCGLRSSFFVTQGTINSKVYIDECLEKRLLPFIRAHEGTVIFWPDLATSHYSKATMEWYASKKINFVPKIANPPNCPELRPIERYWALMKRDLRKSGRTAKNFQDFRLKWKRSYRTVDETTVQHLMKGLKKKVRNFYRKNKIVN